MHYKFLILSIGMLVITPSYANYTGPSYSPVEPSQGPSMTPLQPLPANPVQEAEDATVKKEFKHKYSAYIRDRENGGNGPGSKIYISKNPRALK